MRPGDDDALSWEGDDDPTLDARTGRRRTPRAGEHAPSRESPPRDEPTRDGATGASIRDVPGAADPAQDAPPAADSAALVALGVLGGVYVLYMVGWALGGFRLRDRVQADSGAVADVMLQAAMWLGVLAPAIWFVAAMLLTRGGPPWRRFAALAIGALLLVPWPFVMMGAMGR